MLADKLRAATAAAENIQYVGGYTQGFVGTTSNVTITFGGNLTGGLASSASEGDLVLVWFGTGSTLDRNLVVSGYTEITELYSDDTYDANLVVAYKFMEVTPDNTFVLTGGTLSTADAGAVVVQVFRGVDSIVPLDVVTTTATGASSVLANPPSITPSSAGAWVVAGGAGAHNAGTKTYSSSNLTNFRSVGADDTNDVTVGAGYHQWISGAFDPAAFTFSASNSESYSWAAATLALHPVYTGPAPQFIATTFGGTTYGSSFAVNKPSGTQEGDLMVAVCQAAGPVRWTGDTDWTEIAEQGATSPSLRVAYKIAGVSEPSSYTFTASSSAYNINAHVLTFRNSAYDVVGTFATGADPLVAPSVTASMDYSLLVASFARSAGLVTPSTPTGMTQIALDNNPGAPSSAVFSQRVAAGATGTRSSSLGSAVSVAGIMLVIKPA